MTWRPLLLSRIGAAIVAAICAGMSGGLAYGLFQPCAANCVREDRAMAVVLAVAVGLCGVGFASVLSMRVALHNSTLSITHIFWRTQVIPLSSIASAQPTSSGIAITLTNNRQIVAGAIQISNLRSWFGSPGRAAQICDEITGAAKEERRSKKDASRPTS